MQFAILLYYLFIEVISNITCGGETQMLQLVRRKWKRPMAAFLAFVLVLTTFLPGLSGSALVGATGNTTPAKNTTYTYDFTGNATNIIVPSSFDKANPVDTLVSDYGFLTIHGGNKLYYHDASHGLAIYNGNSFDIQVPGNAIVSFKLCQYSKSGTITVSGGAEGSKYSSETVKLGTGKDEIVEFKYVGDATTLTFTVGDASGEQYLHGIEVENTDQALDITPWQQKNFSLVIGDNTLALTGAAAADATASISLNTGDVYYALSETAYVSLNLGGNALTPSMISTSDKEVIDSIEVKDNVITVIFKDQTSYPSKYVIKVQDKGSYVTPTVTDVFTFDFTKGAIPSELNVSNPIKNFYTTDNGVLTLGKGNGNSPRYHDNSHGIRITSGNYFDIVVSGDAEITFNLCQYSKTGTFDVSNLASGGTGSFDINEVKGTACNDQITYSYKGDATTLRFTLNGVGESYYHSLVVKNTGTLSGSDANEQPKMPTELDSNETLEITPYGHKIFFNQSDSTSGISNMKNTGYYLFDASTGSVKIEADITITATGSSNHGVYFGAFQDTTGVPDIATIGIRGGGSIRNLYNKGAVGGGIGAGGLNTTYQVNDTLHVVMERTNEGLISTVTTPNGTFTYTQKYSNFPFITDASTPLRFGLGFANVSGIIKNLTYTDENGNILYKQTDCYAPIGNPPVVSAVETPTINNDRTEITVTWTGTNCEDDGAYQVELSNDGGKTFTVLANDVTVKTYTATISESGTYVFRISGVCGDKMTEVKTSKELIVKAPLDSTTVKAESGDGFITVLWDAVEGATSYEVYKKSSEENSFKLVTTVAETSFKDTAVTNETPYYYYVIAKSSDNTSNESNIALSVPSSGHVGDYVYEKEAAELFITKKSYDTVYTNSATLEGIVNKAGSLQLEVNGKIVNEITMKAKDKFAFQATLIEGRNDVNLFFTDTNGKITRKAFNFVYLTNYDLVVDASYTGADGAPLVEGSDILVYKTVQAAVNAVPANNATRVVILVKEGSYREHLVITSPNITLIGEDRDLVNINFFDKVESPVGGDTSTRCATYIKASAKNFSAENLSFENTYEYLGDGTISNESADALRVDADGSVFVNVKLLGYQDTLQANSGHQYFYKCYITGNVDYIYGTNGQALFNDCDLVFRYNGAKNSGYVTAPKTDASLAYGYIFNDCRIYAEEGCSGSKYLLARPWGADGSATFINTYMSGIVNKTQPYNDMSGNLAANARFSEYYTYGDGFAINSNRPQISKAQAEAMLETKALGWDPYTTTTSLSTNAYIGTVETITEEKFVETEYIDETADPDSTDDSGLGGFNLEGYAESREVTGGGVLLETASNYYKVSTSEDFLSALVNIKKTGKPSVIELVNDIGIGSLEIGDALTKYSSIIKAHSAQPLLHPTLLQTGVSMLMLKDYSNLTIYSKNGSSIEHACIDINNSSNIIIRNIVFDELWEWDEATHGDYDRNDWDYVTIEGGSTGIWIDHCTFYKAYDGIVDIKKAISTDTTDVTISWSKFLPESEESFFDDMMDLLEANPEKYSYYNELLTTYDMTKEQVRGYAAAQKKTHLVGASDTEEYMENLRVTLANNYYKNSMDRMPRLRAGNAHVYNCILDASDLLELKNSITNPEAAKKVVSNGAISTCGAHVLLENTKIDGILNAIVSGNADSPSGYIGAKNSIYILYDKLTKLTITDGKNNKGDVLEIDANAFIASLPYSDYKLYDAEQLDSKVLPFTGAGTVTMNSTQWQKTSYNDTVIDPEVPENGNDGNAGNNGENNGGNNGGSNQDDSNNNNSNNNNSDNSGSNNNGSEEKPEKLPSTGMVEQDLFMWVTILGVAIFGCTTVGVYNKKRQVK